nr:MAG TPA: hypothetical protein [Caudoviricetes sp.]
MSGSTPTISTNKSLEAIELQGFFILKSNTNVTF